MQFVSFGFDCHVLSLPVYLSFLLSILFCRSLGFISYICMLLVTLLIVQELLHHGALHMELRGCKACPFSNVATIECTEISVTQLAPPLLSQPHQMMGFMCDVHVHNGASIRTLTSERSLFQKETWEGNVSMPKAHTSNLGGMPALVLHAFVASTHSEKWCKFYIFASWILGHSSECPMDTTIINISIQYLRHLIWWLRIDHSGFQALSMTKRV